jgi:hypothetical protein
MTAMSRPVSTRNAVLFVSVLLLGVAVRLYGQAAYTRDANFEFKFPQDIVAAQAWATILILAFAGSLIGAVLGNCWNRAAAALMGPVGAAVATAHYSWILGAVLGAPAGLLTVWLGSRRLATITLPCVAAVAIGLGSGAALGAVSSGPVNPVAFFATLLCAGVAVAAISRHAAKFLPLNSEVARSRRVTSRLALPAMALLAVAASLPVGITLESVAWLRRTGGHNEPELRRLNAGCFTRGLCQFDRWYAPPEFRSSDLRKLRRFDGIKWLWLNRRDFDDEALALVSEWPRLECLGWTGAAGRRSPTWLTAVDLSRTRVTGATFAKLPPSLTDLWLTGAPVTDESLTHLSKLSGLKELHLAETSVGDAGVAKLAGLSVLRYLDLSGAKLTDAALKSLARNNPSVEILELRATSITRTGLAHLADLPKLVLLDVSNCRLIDDDAIQILASARSLGLIRLGDAKVTRAGAMRLSAAMPRCIVECGQDQLRRD